jgi:hypothetical protein
MPCLLEDQQDSRTRELVEEVDRAFARAEEKARDDARRLARARSGSMDLAVAPKAASQPQGVRQLLSALIVALGAAITRKFSSGPRGPNLI